MSKRQLFTTFAYNYRRVGPTKMWSS